MKNALVAPFLFLSTLALSGCYSIRTDSTFTLSGAVVTSNGSPMVLQPTDGYEICIEVSYTTTKKELTTDAYKKDDCMKLVTDQAGHFSIARQVKLSGSGDLITIKNAKMYARKQSSQNVFYMIPASIDSLHLNSTGGKIVAKIVTM